MIRNNFCSKPLLALKLLHLFSKKKKEQIYCILQNCESQTSILKLDRSSNFFVLVK
ncbi:hypothetical protein LguiA_027406 [Lonicera macranthoides]